MAACRCVQPRGQHGSEPVHRVARSPRRRTAGQHRLPRVRGPRGARRAVPRRLPEHPLDRPVDQRDDDDRRPARPVGRGPCPVPGERQGQRGIRRGLGRRRGARGRGGPDRCPRARHRAHDRPLDCTRLRRPRRGRRRGGRHHGRQSACLRLHRARGRLSGRRFSRRSVRRRAVAARRRNSAGLRPGAVHLRARRRQATSRDRSASNGCWLGSAQSSEAAFRDRSVRAWRSWTSCPPISRPTSRPSTSRS